MEILEQLIGYCFSRRELLAEALTHPSLAYETQREQPDNQRLEFLGDAVLQLIITHHLYAEFPQFGEGSLTKLRARLVSRPALHTYARRIRLGDFLLMGRGEDASGGRDRASTLADAFEALVGAIYLDAGMETARQAVLRLCGEDIAIVRNQPLEVNPKGQLQEILQSIAPGSPRYHIVSEEGPDHRKRFEVRVEWNGKVLGLGSGNSKKEAETAAAAVALASPELPRPVDGSPAPA